MGELKNQGRERVQEHQEQYGEIQQEASEAIEERDRNLEVIRSLEGVDDDDKSAIEDGRGQGKEIASQIAESSIETPKNEVNTQVEATVTEMHGLETREEADAGKAGGMDGNYGGVGSNLESKFSASAAEFNDIASSGEEVKETSNAALEAMAQNLKMDW